MSSVDSNYDDDDNDDEDDSWYEKMQSQYDDLSDEGTDGNNLTGESCLIEQLSDSQYYEEVNNYGVNNTIFQPENSVIWQHFSENQAASFTPVSVPFDFLKIKDWLFNNLPHSSKLYGTINHIPCKIYTNSLSSPNVAFAITDEDLSNKLCCITLYTDTPNDPKILNNLCACIHNLDYNEFEIAGLQYELKLMSTLEDERYYISSWSSHAYELHVLTCSIPPIQKVELPFRVDKIRFHFYNFYENDDLYRLN